MVAALSYLTETVHDWWLSVRETDEQKYRREMVKYLNQAIDLRHLEQLEREWEQKHGRKYW